MIYRSIRKISIVIIFSLSVLSGNAQQHDFWLWNTLGIEKKISKKTSLAFDQEVRFFKNITQLNLIYTNIGGVYRVTDYFKTALTYRYLLKRQDDASYSFRHRFYIDATLKKRFTYFDISYRARLQTQFRDVYSSEKGAIPESYWRNKFNVKFDLKNPFAPYVAAEFRYQLGNMHQKESDYCWNRGRYYVGFDYSLNKASAVGAYYMLQWEYNVNDPERDNVIGIEYNLTL